MRKDIYSAMHVEIIWYQYILAQSTLSSEKSSSAFVCGRMSELDIILKGYDGTWAKLRISESLNGIDTK